MFFEAGVKNQNLKLGPIALRFCMGLQGTNTNFFCFLDHIDLGLYSKNTAILKKKNQSMFFEAGVKNQNFKLKPIALRFCMGLQGPNTNFFCFLDHIDLGPYLKVMAVLKEKMPVFWKQSPTKKNVTAQKSFRICFYFYLDGQKKNHER